MLYEVLYNSSFMSIDINRLFKMYTLTSAMCEIFFVSVVAGKSEPVLDRHK
jgi:hypothetical protein